MTESNYNSVMGTNIPGGGPTVMIADRTICDSCNRKFSGYFTNKHLEAISEGKKIMCYNCLFDQHLIRWWNVFSWVRIFFQGRRGKYIPHKEMVFTDINTAHSVFYSPPSPCD